MGAEVDMGSEIRTVADNHGVMTRAQIEAVFARREEAYDNLDAAALAADYADDAVIESPVSGPHGKAEARQSIDAIFRAFLDLTMTTEALIIDGNHVAHVATFEGTNIGGMFGLPPSGKSFKVPAVFVYEFKNGKIVRERRVYDFTGMLLQVGVLKAKPTSEK
jgi:steroid delta-isomerase-like uncharacterized protein